MPETGPTLVSPAPRGSILKSRLSTRHSRSDSLGNIIEKGGKKHKVVFKPELTDVFEVESFKHLCKEEPTPEAPEGKWCCNIQ